MYLVSRSPKAGLTLLPHSESWAHRMLPSLSVWVRGLLNYIPLHSRGNEFGFSEHTPAGWGEAAQKAAGWGRGRGEEEGEGARPR